MVLTVYLLQEISKLFKVVRMFPLIKVCAMFHKTHIQSQCIFYKVYRNMTIFQHHFYLQCVYIYMYICFITLLSELLTHDVQA